MRQQNYNNQADRPIDWSRKFKGAITGFAGGSMIGGIGSLLHSRGTYIG